MHPNDECVICQKENVQWHHIIKQKTQKQTWRHIAPPDIPLCPKHHKLADLGKISIEEQQQLKRDMEALRDLIYRNEEAYNAQPWETDYSEKITNPEYRDSYFDYDPDSYLTPMQPETLARARSSYNFHPGIILA